MLVLVRCPAGGPTKASAYPSKRCQNWWVSEAVSWVFVVGHPLIVVSVILWMGKLWNQLVGQLFQGFINKISPICMIVGPGNHRKPEFSISGAVHKVPGIFIVFFRGRPGRPFGCLCFGEPIVSMETASKIICELREIL